ncbi:uncharacterized protein F4807DRAFT_470267 [Annulohypoxylon truncatum]|uniref:uncharacterized protein n=1 Tax=Annulohypoxylon truncatum TaxID=327061 RepID=UPI002007F7B8|nr:uncharacterized protein F4807DRAFT_470267 [Annulohypoxylon truncatum]KAI1206278.1 hypothetical protein F4807DRAFT_470267 [Annulohypoxylon truncatum]
MGTSSNQNQKSASPPGTPLRDYDGDTPMTNATPFGATTQGTRQSPSTVNTPMPAPRRSLLARSIQTEYIATPRSSRASSTSSTDSVPIEATPGMVPRSSRIGNNPHAATARSQTSGQQQRTPPPRYAQPATPYPAGGSTSTSTPSLPGLPTTTPLRASLSSLASSTSSFRSSVLAGERPMPETPAAATMGTPQEMPERRRSSRFVPRDSLGVISPTNPTHRRASALFQPQSAAAREAEAEVEAEEMDKEKEKARRSSAAAAAASLKKKDKKEEEKAGAEKDKDVDMEGEKDGAEFEN